MMYCHWWKIMKYFRNKAEPLTVNQWMILQVAKRLKYRTPKIYTWPVRKWKKVWSFIFWGIKPKYDFSHGHITFGDKLIHRHVPMHALTEYALKGIK